MFATLFDHGDTAPYGEDDSAADFALLGVLKFYTRGHDQLDRIMRASTLRRPKWDSGVRTLSTWAIPLGRPYGSRSRQCV